MEIGSPRDWDSTDWERFALRLVQVRHGAQNVQTVPDRVRGDAGIEYLTTDGCCYQCYAPAQSSDTKKAASAMRHKAARDLAKIKENQGTIMGMLGTRQIIRWILLCPFLDDKSVIAHIQTRASSLSLSELSFVSADFYPLVQSLDDFAIELETLRLRSLGIPIEVAVPSHQTASVHFLPMGTQIDAKLERGFPNVGSKRRRSWAHDYVRAHLMCADTLERLKQDYPDLWESYRRALSVEEVRLGAVGPSIQDASAQLNGELQRLEDTLTIVLRSLDSVTISTLAHGTVATWLMECPLDFE